jgi:hypothetical protein
VPREELPSPDLLDGGHELVEGEDAVGEADGDEHLA